MSNGVKIRVQRVFCDDEATRPISSTGFVHGEVPADGFILKAECPGSIPIYVRDEDLTRAARVREEKGKPVPIDGVSWGSLERDGNNDGR